MKTLTDKGIEKILTRFSESLDHATYQQGKVSVSVDIYTVDIQRNRIKIYVLLGSDVSGSIRDIALVDRDGDTVAVAEREFVKPANKGIYSVFSYQIVETDDPDAPLLGGDG